MITVGYILATYFGNIKGGFEQQAESALIATANNNNNVRLAYFDFTYGEEYDILHFWGVENIASEYLSRSRNSKIVVSVLLSYFTTPLAIYKWWPKMLILHGMKFLTNYMKISAITVVNEEQRLIAQKLFPRLRKNIYVIPNIVRDEYYLKKRSQVCGNYCVCIGNISERKSQLELVELFDEIDYNIYFIGDIDRNTSYGKKFQRAVNRSKRAKFLGVLPNGSDKIIDYLDKSSFLILASKSETQPISVLESLVRKKQVILRKADYTDQYKNKEGVIVLDDFSVSNLGQIIDQITNEPFQAVYDEFRANVIGQQYLSVYNEIVNCNHSSE